ncbi:LacI family DNA-binding transcriptional regulator [Arthrobacter sp. AZCC_0090]|uniref:LacI family DNA-binding transcriptional regulator n=1 Tax=Arthrobacter sp. AZCC_0090 TaxID=2735881 RepID=UPI00160B0E65|nr:LacI family DNA-binding transcriptional regulator [Arthrobacter sp. AZCC_0090]MBB6406615.1 DNA-binding LacI/PurR family transcriptional regulator [Arthrobacter sp. AZCC_0090]
MTQRNSRSTIREVAREAGVSVTTVSHALSGKGIVAESTRAKVVETARRLRYRPNAVASGLRNNRLGILALVLRPLDTLESFLPEGVDYFLRFAGAASLSALEHGYGLMLLSDPTLPDAPSISLAADGFIITEPVENDPVIDLLQAEGIPLLTVGKDLGRPHYDAWIEPRTAKITRHVLDHLEENGAARVAIAIGTDRNSWNITTEASYREWCSERGQEPIVVTQRETSGTLGGRAIGEEILSMTDRPDAVYCLTGRHAAGMMARLGEAGIASPADILIVAGSDSEQTRNSVPPISAIDLEPEVLARAAIAALVEQLVGIPNRGSEAGTDGRFIIRGSSQR